jgi:hypothetical protein
MPDGSEQESIEYAMTVEQTKLGYAATCTQISGPIQEHQHNWSILGCYSREDIIKDVEFHIKNEHPDKVVQMTDVRLKPTTTPE